MQLILSNKLFRQQHQERNPTYDKNGEGIDIYENFRNGKDNLQQLTLSGTDCYQKSVPHTQSLSLQ